MWPWMPHAPMRPCAHATSFLAAQPPRSAPSSWCTAARQGGGAGKPTNPRGGRLTGQHHRATEECDYLAAFSRFTITIAPARSLQQDPSGSPSRSMLPGRVPHGHRHGQLSADQTHTNRPKAAKVTLWGSSPALSPVIFRPHITLRLDWCRKQKQIFLKLHRASRVASIGGAGLQGSLLIWAPSLSALDHIASSSGS